MTSDETRFEEWWRANKTTDHGYISHKNAALHFMREEGEACAKVAESSERCHAETNECIKKAIPCVECVAAAIRARSK